MLTDVFERGSLFQFELLQWAFGIVDLSYQKSLFCSHLTADLCLRAVFSDGWFDALRLWVILFAASLTIVPLQRFWASRRINTRLYFFLHGTLLDI